MKTNLVLVSFLLVSIVFFGQENFRYTHQSPKSSEGRYGIATSDSSYIAVGNIDKFIKTDTIIRECIDCEYQMDTIIYDLITSDIFIIKSDSKGDTIWTKKIGNEGNDWSHYISETKDKGYIVCGTDSSYSGNVIKLDSLGKIMWKSIIPNHMAQKVFESDSLYIVLGTKSHVINGNPEIYVQALNKLGNVIWIRYFGRSFSAACIDVNNNIFIIGGDNYFEIDCSGSILSQGKLSSTGIKDVQDIIAAGDNNYLILYNYADIPVYNRQPRLLKINHSGEKIWEKGYFDYTYYDIGTHLEKTKDNGVIITGLLNSNIPDISSSYILKTDSCGKPLWIKNFRYDSTDYIRPYFITETYDDHYFMVGTNNMQRLTLVKTNDENSNQNVEFKDITNINDISIRNPFTTYPNPAQDYVNIELDEIQSAHLNIYDLSGKIVFDYLLSDNKKQIKLTGLNNGVYIIKLSTKDKIFTNKLIITRP